MSKDKKGRFVYFKKGEVKFVKPEAEKGVYLAAIDGEYFFVRSGNSRGVRIGEKIRFDENSKKYNFRRDDKGYYITGEEFNGLRTLVDVQLFEGYASFSINERKYKMIDKRDENSFYIEEDINTIAAISDLLGLKPEEVEKTIDELEEKGLLIRKETKETCV